MKSWRRGRDGPKRPDHPGRPVDDPTDRPLRPGSPPLTTPLSTPVATPRASSPIRGPAAVRKSAFAFPILRPAAVARRAIRVVANPAGARWTWPGLSTTFEARRYVEGLPGLSPPVPGPAYRARNPRRPTRRRST
jgi:hypothetical protein